MFKSSNPAMKENAFATLHEQDFASSGKMTIAGTVNKTAILLVLAVITGSVSWSMIHNNPATGIPLIIGGFVGGLIFAIITIFSNPVTSFDNHFSCVNIKKFKFNYKIISIYIYISRQ